MVMGCSRFLHDFSLPLLILDQNAVTMYVLGYYLDGMAKSWMVPLLDAILVFPCTLLFYPPLMRLSDRGHRVLAICLAALLAVVAIACLLLTPDENAAEYYGRYF